MTRVRFDVREDKKSSSEDEGFTRIQETPKEQWDCESILSKHCMTDSSNGYLKGGESRFVSELPENERRAAGT